MKLVCQTKLQYREGSADKVYEVDLCETGAEKFVVNFRYGRRGTELKEGTKTLAPVGFKAAEQIFQKLVDEKKRKGYHAVGETRAAAENAAAPKPRESAAEARRAAILAVLGAPKAKSHPRLERFIWRAGELKMREAAPLLPSFIGTAKALRDYCVAWSLGFCGDADSIPALEKLTSHPTEHVARIAREALRRLADENRRAELTARALDELPPALRAEAVSGTPESFAAALRDEMARAGRVSFDTLARVYEIDSAVTRPALLAVLRDVPLKPRFFRPVRHIFKAAEYRRDAQVFGLVARRFEIEKNNFWRNPWGDWILVPKADGEFNPATGVYETVKISELKKEDSRLAYGDRTRDYLRRRAWRTLRRLGELGDADYVRMAAGALLPYSDADVQEPKRSVFYDYYHKGRYDWRDPQMTETFWDSFAPYLLFNHVLYENSPRFEHKPGSRAFRVREGQRPGAPAPAAREEAFPQLWEAEPRALVHLLAESECRPVHEFAAKALRACPDFTRRLDAATILMLLEKPYEMTNELGFEIAVALYDARRPDVELAVAVAVCRSEAARREAFRWIEAARATFAKNERAVARLLTAEHADTRRFAANLLQSTNYAPAEAQALIARLVAELLGLDEARAEIADDLGEALFRGFGRELRSLNPAIAGDLLAHPLAGAQILGARILLDHETPAARLPNELIDALVNSASEQARAIGLKLFGRLPDENLLRREPVIVSLLAHELADVHHAARPTAFRLAAVYPQFRVNLVNAVILALLRPERAEGVHARLLDALQQVEDWAAAADLETARLLAQSDFPAAGDLGGRLFAARADDWREAISTADLLAFSNHETLSLRRASWEIAEKNVDRLRGEVSLLTRALDAKWADSREFWRTFFRTRFAARELTPEILVAICDSVREETQKFGRDLLLDYFKAENGAEYLVKLSEHPSAAMQLFATNYLENYAAGDAARIERLAPYFTAVLSQVNRARAAKTRVLRFLETEALRDERAAAVAARILARQSATIAIGDKAAMIETMLKIRRRYPALESPLKINPTEVRAVNAV